METLARTAIANVIDCTMFTNTPDSIMVGLSDFLLAPGGGFFTKKILSNDQRGRGAGGRQQGDKDAEIPYQSGVTS